MGGGDAAVPPLGGECAELRMAARHVGEARAAVWWAGNREWHRAVTQAAGWVGVSTYECPPIVRRHRRTLAFMGHRRRDERDVEYKQWLDILTFLDVDGKQRQARGSARQRTARQEREDARARQTELSGNPRGEEVKEDLPAPPRVYGPATPGEEEEFKEHTASIAVPVPFGALTPLPFHFVVIPLMHTHGCRS